MSAFDAGSPLLNEQRDGRYFRFRGQAVLTSPSQCIEFAGLPSIVTSTFVSFEAGAEPFSPEIGYTDDFTDATINARNVTLDSAVPYQSQAPIALAASAGSVFIRPQPQTTVPSVGSPLTVEYDVVFREGHRDTSLLGMLRAGITAVSSVFTGFLNTLPWSIYKLLPTTRADGQGGPLMSEPLGSLLTNGTWVAGGTIADLTAAYQKCELTSGSGLDLVPDRGALGLLRIKMLVGDATSLTFTVKLTSDEAGDELLLGPTTVAVEPGQTTATTKGATLDLNKLPYKRGSLGVTGKMWAWVLCNAVPAGTQLTTVRLEGEYR